MGTVATKLAEITDEQWQSVNEENRKKVEEFLLQSVQLSDETLKQYTSALRIYFYWVKENLENKLFSEIKTRDFLLYQNQLIRNGLSSSAIRLKRSAVSSFNKYIELYYDEEYIAFRNYVNKIPAPTRVFVHDKEPLTLEEYESLCSKLQEMEHWQELAYLKFSFASGARRSEVRQLLKEVIAYEPKIIGDKKIYNTHEIRCKGKGKAGKVRKLQFDESAMLAIKKWLEIRGEDSCPFVFVSKTKSGEVKQVLPEGLNAWCSNLFEKLVGRRVHPHLFRESRATTMVVEQQKDIKIAQKLLGHLSSVTTDLYVIRKDGDDSDEAFI